MNTRALLLGVAMGLVVAVVPSCNCGGGTCSGANCGGCCDATGACVKRPDNGNDGTCGNQGSACVDCASLGQTCNKSTFVCAGSGNGGGAGGGGGAITDGCLLPSGTPVPLAQVNTTNCGKDGALCTACVTGESCPRTGPSAGTCVTATKKVGDPCAGDGECALLGAGAICKLVTNPGGASYLGGYCTFLCTGAGDPTCPSGSECISLNPQYGESDSLCMDVCASGTDPCRNPGYSCYNITGGATAVKACWIAPLPSLDAGPPSLRTGEPCDAGSDCTPAGTGACFTETVALSDGGIEQSGYLGGYCSRLDCISSNDCATDGGGLCLSDGAGNRACMRRCNGPSTGAGDCRTGYVCQGYLRGLVDGGTAPSTDGYCTPDCHNVSGYCGVFPDGGQAVCSALGYCP